MTVRLGARRAERHGRSGVLDDAHTYSARCCEPTTCVRDRARVSWPAGNHRHSNERGNGGRDVPLRSSRVDRKKEPKNFCCVTTRGPEPPHLLVLQTLPHSPDGVLHDGEPAVVAPLPHGPAALRGGPAAVVAAWQPASTARAAGIPGFGSSVGSSGEADRRHRTLGADNHGVEAGCG